MSELKHHLRMRILQRLSLYHAVLPTRRGSTVCTLHFVSEEERDVIFDLISSNRMQRHESFGNCAYRLTSEDIDFVTLPKS